MTAPVLLPFRMRNERRKLASMAAASLFLTLIGSVAPVAAQSWPIPPIYSLGIAHSYAYDAASSGLHPSRLTHGSSPYSGSSMSWRSSSFLGGEIRYSALLSQNSSAQVFVPALGQQTYYQSVPVTFNAYASLAQRTELIGRMGLVMSNPSAGARQCLDASGRVYDCQSTPLTYGLGLRYDLHDSVRLRMDFDLLESRELSFGPRSRSSFFSIGASYQY